MREFIKVKTVLDEDLYINGFEIKTFKKCLTDSGSIITFKDESVIYVKTKPEEILSLLEKCYKF
jgi:hypothetical protein